MPYSLHDHCGTSAPHVYFIFCDYIMWRLSTVEYSHRCKSHEPKGRFPEKLEGMLFPGKRFSYLLVHYTDSSCGSHGSVDQYA